MAKRKVVGSLNVAFNSIAEGLESARALLRTTATELLDTQVARGNTIYTIDVDKGKASKNQGRDIIQKANQRVTIRFIKASLDVAVAELKQALIAEIQRTTKRHTGELETSVTLLYAQEGKPYVEISGQGDLQEFGTGDTIALLPTAFYQAFVNSAVADKNGDKGFMVRAAAKIRRKLRLKQTTRSLGAAPGLSISVGRSRAAAAKINIPANTTGRRTGRPRGPIPKDAGAPVIFMRIKGGARRQTQG